MSIAMVILVVGVCCAARAQAEPSLDWDETTTGNVTGFAVTIDGARTDYGLSPEASAGTCSCSIPLPFSGGAHSIVVSAYNTSGETPSASLNVGPQASPGGPYSGLSGSSITVSGAGSADTSGGSLTSYEWQWGDGSSAISSSASSASHVYANAGTYTLSLTVADNGGATAEGSTVVTVSTALASTTLPSPWQQADVGSVGLAGSASYANGTFTVAGAGADVWGMVDAFHYVYQPLSGDGQLIARVVNLANTSAWAKAGVMIRETLAATSTHVMLDLTPTGGIEFMDRTTTGGTAAIVGSTTSAPPAWLKLVRAGTAITAFLSADGSSWSDIGTTSVTMASTVDIGLIVCSHDTGTLNTSTFDHVSMLQGSVAMPPGSPISPGPTDGATGVALNPALTWSDSGATSYDVKFGASNPPAQVSTGGAASSYAPASLSASTEYFWQVVAHNSVGTTNGPVWSFTTTAPTQTTGVPAPWVSQDIGAVGSSGSATFSSGTFSLTGSGADIWGTADAFHYVYQPLSGDGQILLRVDTLQNTNPYAKAGVMIRDSSDGSSPHVILDVRPNGAIEFMTRSTQSGATTYIAGATQSLPAWLKLVRAGGDVTGYVSGNGSTWTQVGSISTTLPAAALIGLLVTSHDTTQSATATFDAVSASAGTAPPPVQSSNNDVVLYASDATAAVRHGSWTSSPSADSPNGIMLATPDQGVAHADAPLAAPTDYVDLTFSANAGTPYRVWVRLRALNDSKFNDSLWVQFSDAQVNGASAYAVNTTSGLLVNLASDSSGDGLSGWGWQNGAYWLSQATTITFPTGGMHTVRMQVREDGVEFDQIVLSPGTYLNAPPGQATDDQTIVSR